MAIEYLQYSDLDKTLWDKCINQSVNGLVYPYSWYLDMVAIHWDALVLDDYKAVMPLPYRQRMGLTSVYQPYFAHQLGVFTGGHLHPDLVESFLNAIPAKFRRVDLNLNSYNKVKNPKWVHKQYVTHQLDLIVSYSFLASKYNDKIQHTLWIAQSNKIQVYKQLNLKDFLLLKKENAKEPITFEQLDLMRKIIPFCLNYNLGDIYGAFDENSLLVAAAFFIRTHQKTIMLTSAQSEDGKDLGALVAIIDRYIGQNAEKNLTLDFAGPLDNEDDAIFTGFGAQPVSYYRIKQNRLPVLGRIF